MAASQGCLILVEFSSCLKIGILLIYGGIIQRIARDFVFHVIKTNQIK